MNRLRTVFLLLLVLEGTLALPRTTLACPACADAVAASGDNESRNDDGDPLRESRAYNQSTLFMVAVPYLVFAFLVLLIFRASRAATRRNLEEAALLQSGPTKSPISA
jgi:hypothetical protein